MGPAQEGARITAKRPWYKKKRFIIPGALLLVLIFAGIVGGEGDTPDRVAGGENGADSDVEAADGGQAEAGARDNPIPLGQTADLGEWRLTVIGTTPNATDEVMAENQFNDPPAAGRQFFIARIRATYIGEDSGTYWIGVGTKALDASNVTYEAFGDANCGVIPDDIRDRGETFQGGIIEGNVCWAVETANVDTLVMFAEPTFSFRRDRVWFALR